VAPVHATPFSANAVGAVFEPVQEALNPNDADAPVPRPAFQLALAAETWVPDWVTVAFHPWLTRCPAGNVQVRFQPLMGSPRFVTATLPVNPSPHCEATV
jgi:hypothetical protein